jgi:hypothetical protein
MNSGRHLGVSARLPVGVYYTNTRDVDEYTNTIGKSVKWSGLVYVIGRRSCAGVLENEVKYSRNADGHVLYNTLVFIFLIEKMVRRFQDRAAYRRSCVFWGDF